MKHFLTIAILCFAAIAGRAAEYTVQTVPNDQLSDARDFVTNPDGIISSRAESEINHKIAITRDSTSAEIAVVLLNSIGTQDIDNFATDLFVHWKIGKSANDNGLLFLLVYDQKQMVFRTGYGLEGVLPDAYLSRIIRNDIAPHLKEGNFDAGVIAGIDRACDYLLNPEAAAEVQQQDNRNYAREFKQELLGYLTVSLIAFVVAVILMFVFLRNKKTNYTKYLALNKGKVLVIVLTIFFPLLILFCIFYFIIKSRMRSQPIHCLECGHKMHRLGEQEEDPYLTPAQLTEELVKSVDYDVWLCDNCNHREILHYDKLSRFMPCPHCQAKTYYLKNDYTITAATTLASGLGERIYSCQHCHLTDTSRYTIPKIILSSGGGGSRGFGGGGFGGGGGSWGGGRTGGGGARGGW